MIDIRIDIDRLITSKLYHSRFCAGNFFEGRYRTVVDWHAGGFSAFGVVSSDFSGQADRIFIRAAVMNDHMGPMIILCVEPEIALPAAAEGQCFILKIVSSVTDADPVKFRFKAAFQSS